MKAEVSGLGSSEESRTRIPRGALTGNHHAEPNYELVKCVRARVGGCVSGDASLSLCFCFVNV